MRGSYCVASHFLKYAYLALCGANIYRGSQGAQIVVHAYALKLDASAVEFEAVVAVVGNRAEPKARSVRVQNFAAAGNFRNGAVEIRRFQIPQLGVFYFYLLGYARAFAIEFQLVFSAPGNLVLRV